MASLYSFSSRYSAATVSKVFSVYLLVQSFRMIFRSCSASCGCPVLYELTPRM
ncbi:hypothetical protein D3C80_972980 [compost metagenome]